MAKTKRSSSERGQLRAMVFSGIALACGVVAVFVLNGLVQGYRLELERARQPEDTVMVMVAARDLYQGITIEEADLYAVEVPPRYLPESVFLSPDHVVGRIPRERILANEFVRGDRLADPESGRGMNAVIPRGLRAISIDLADGRALGGFLKPGNYVDVLVTIAPRRDGGERVTKTVLQSLFVMGVDSRMDDEGQEEAADRRGKHRPSVTLLVTAEEAERVAFAHAMGDVRLSLRSNDDLDPNVEIGDGVTLAQLRRRVAPTQPVARVRNVEPDYASFTIWRGPDGKDYKVDAEGRIVD